MRGRFFLQRSQKILFRSSILSSRFQSSLSPPTPITHDLLNFFSKQPIDKHKINLYLSDHISAMTSAEIALLLIKASKFYYILNPNFLTIIAETLKTECRTVTRAELVQIIYSFKDYDNNIPAMTQMRGAVVQILKARERATGGGGGSETGGTSGLNSRSLAMCLYGMKNMHYEMKYVPQIIHYLLGYLKESPRDFSLQTLSHAFRGLTNLSSDLPLTRELIAILHSKLIVCSSSDLLETKDVVNCLRSFQSLSLATSEASSLVTALLPHIQRYDHYATSSSGYPERGRAPFLPKDLVNMYRGVAAFDLRHEEAVQLFQHLLHWLQRPLSPLSAMELIRILHTLKDKDKTLSPIKETVISLCDSLFKLTEWDPTLATAKTLLSIEEITLAIQALQLTSGPLPRDVSSSIRSFTKFLTCSLRHHSAFLTSNELYRLFHGGAVLSSAHPEGRELLLLLGEKLQHPSLELSPKTACAIVKSLRYMDPSHEEVLTFLELLTRRLASLPHLEISEKWTCIYGLQSLYSSNPTVRAFLAVLNSKFVPYPPSYRHTPQSVGCTFFGLQSLSPTHSEVKQLLQIILADYQSVAIRLDTQAIANLFFGLRNLHDHTITESRLLVQLVIQLLKRNQQDVVLSVAGISQLMVGIKSFSSESEQALELLDLITGYFQQSREVIDSRTVVTCVTSLKNFSIMAPQTERFLSLLVEKIELMARFRPQEQLSSSQIAELCSGLRNMSTLTPALHSLLTLLDNSVSCLSTHQLYPSDLLSCLLGLRQLLSSSPCSAPPEVVLSLLRNLLDHVHETSSLSCTVREYTDYLSTLQHLPPGHPITVGLMAYLVSTLPHLETALASPLSWAQVSSLVLGLSHQDLEQTETKALLSHATALIETSKRQQPPASPTGPLSSGEEVEVLRLCQGLAELGKGSSEFDQLVATVTDMLRIASPRLTAETKTAALESLSATRGGVVEVSGLLAVIRSLAEAE
jgi:hypothetical protein